MRKSEQLNQTNVNNIKGKSVTKEASDVKRNQPATGLHANHHNQQRQNERYKEISSSIDESSPNRAPPTVTKPLSVVLFLSFLFRIYSN